MNPQLHRVYYICPDLYSHITLMLKSIGQDDTHTYKQKTTLVGVSNIITNLIRCSLSPLYLSWMPGANLVNENVLVSTDDVW
jgi:hypothetical protein